VDAAMSGDEVDTSAALIREWRITTSSTAITPDRLSGGNQQKIVLAKWLRNEPKVLLMDEPTQGVDVGAKAGIFELIANAAVAGAGILICSSDEKELVLICDRVLVMRDGSLVGEVARSELSEAVLVRAGLSAGADNGGKDHDNREVPNHA